MEKIKISAVIIAKNEERRIGRCLGSLTWADEVIVVDGNSSDRTPEIAKSSGAKVIEHGFTGSFADDRNAGLEVARNDWVLALDADEVVTEDFKEKAARAIASPGKAVIYKFRRKNFFMGHSMEHGGFHHYIPNLVNRRFVRFEGHIHEVPVYKGEVATLEADVEHYPFDSIAQFIERQNRYTSIAAREMLDREGALKERDIRRQMINRSLKIFWKSYVKKQGYKEGMYGLVFATIFAIINFMKWAKYWEMTKERCAAT